MKIWRILCVAGLALLMGLGYGRTALAEEQSIVYDIESNPLYDEAIYEWESGEELLAEDAGSTEEPPSEEPVYLEKAAAIVELNKAMEQMSELYTAYFISDSAEARDESRALWRAARGLISNPVDEFYFHYAAYKARISYVKRDDAYYYKIIYEIRYYLTDEQRQAMYEEVDAVLSAISPEGKSKEKLIREIYTYLAKTVDYDYENLYNADYTLKYTAYAALLEHKAVCQGYAVAFYLLCRKCDIDVRVIPGTSYGQTHAWNIVELDGVYYNIDTTWESSNYIEGNPFMYYMLNTEDFHGHTREEEYETEEFHQRYPMAESSYVIPVEPEIVAPGQPVLATVTMNEDRSVLTVTWEETEADFIDLSVSIGGEEYTHLETIPGNLTEFSTANSYKPGMSVYFILQAYNLAGEEKLYGEASERKGIYIPIDSVSFKTVGTFTGKKITFFCTTPDTVIYYSTVTGNVTTEDHKVENGESVDFSGFYGSIYARAYHTETGRFGNVSRFILKVGTLPKPTMFVRGDKLFIVSYMPGAYIAYTTDATDPSWENGKKVLNSCAVLSLSELKRKNIKMVEAVVYRNCYQNSAVGIYHF